MYTGSVQLRTGGSFTHTTVTRIVHSANAPSGSVARNVTRSRPQKLSAADMFTWTYPARSQSWTSRFVKLYDRYTSSPSVSSKKADSDFGANTSIAFTSSL